ncbi:hypothetical protein ACJZ2D_009909 [Fusarium nematophilum]
MLYTLSTLRHLPPHHTTSSELPVLRPEFSQFITSTLISQPTKDRKSKSKSTRNHRRFSKAPLRPLPLETVYKPLPTFIKECRNDLIAKVEEILNRNEFYEVSVNLAHRQVPGNPGTAALTLLILGMASILTKNPPLGTLSGRPRPSSMNTLEPGATRTSIFPSS